MTTSGQTINDRLNAAKYTLAGQSLARCVCKATTEEIIGPKRKHLDYLLACSHVTNVSIPQLANMLIERTNQTRWVVVYKALITVHHLMSFGNERFTQYLASNNYSFQLGNFLDRLDHKGYGMSTFIRRYSRYLNSKALSYRTLAIDLCRIKPGQNNKIRTMPVDRLLKTIPVIQSQMDSLLEFQCSPSELNNGVVNASFLLLFKDLIKLFATYNDAIIHLLEIYFDLDKKLCREAFELYKKFLVRVDKVSDFLKLADSVGIDKGNIPDLRRAPSSLVEALEQHLLSIEGSKRGKGSNLNTQKDQNKQIFTDNFNPNSLDIKTVDNSKTKLEDDPWNDVDISSLSLKQVLDEEEKAFKEFKSHTADIFAWPEPKASSSLSAIKIVGPPVVKESQSSNPFVTDFSEESKIKSDIFNPFGESVDSFGLVSKFNQQTPNNVEGSYSTCSNTLSDIHDQKEFEETFSDTMKLSIGDSVAKPIQPIRDIIPPGYSGGSLLKPETIVQPQINPSIDPQTQYQLLQIHREQAEFRQSMRHSGNINNDNNIAGTNGSNNSTLTRPQSSLDKRMSAFEDLELVMRQTLKKSEKIT